MSISTVYGNTPVLQSVLLNYANPSRDGSGTISSVFTSGINGSYIDKVWVQMSPFATASGGTNSANIIKIYLSDSINWRIYKEIEISLTTMGDTNIAAKKAFNIEPALLLSPGYIVGANLAWQTNSTIDQYTITVEGYNY